ncbi:MAG: OmpH family outer membrane protein [Neomegalonema sp.]|nr:OmpH family outer membrane protein [Neomegalonema sp.]
MVRPGGTPLGWLVGALMVAGASIAYAQIAYAQDGDRAPTQPAQAPIADPGSGSERSDVLVVDVESIVREAESFADIRSQMQAAREAMRTRFELAQAAFREEEDALMRLRETLPIIEFREQAASFETRVRQARREHRDREAALQQAFNSAIVTMRRQGLWPVLKQIMQERGASVMIHAQYAELFRPDLDVTREAVARLDAAGARITIAIPSEGPSETEQNPLPAE